MVKAKEEVSFLVLCPLRAFTVLCFLAWVG